MDPVLLIVTGVSLLVALVMSAAAWRVSREERARSAARVAALAAAAANEPVESPRPIERPELVAAASPEPAAVVSEPRAPWAAARISSFTPTHRAAPAQPPRVPELALHRNATEELPLRTDFLGARSAGPPTREEHVGASFLGSAAAPASNGRQRGLAVAASVLFVLIGGAAYWTVFGPRSTSASAALAAPASAPLELVSLRHERRGSRLSVSGLVRNPSAGSPVENLIAVVFLFDQSGGLVTSSRTDVDFKRLAPGDESPFVMAIDAPSSVARYRVSFRTEAGIVPHVDRRGQDPALPGNVGQTAATTIVR